MLELPPNVRQKLEQRNFWQFVTLNEDGAPTATPLWVHVDDEHILVNTGSGRRKERNVRRDPRVALALVDVDDPYSWIEIRGRVVDFVTGKEADDSLQLWERSTSAPRRRLSTRRASIGFCSRSCRRRSTSGPSRATGRTTST
jgi:PPOX class probable F420-dependent enzyme